MVAAPRRSVLAAESAGVIVTPEAVVLDLQTGGVASRLCAGLIDAAVRIGLLILGSVPLAFVDVGETVARVVAAFLLFFVIVGYPIVTELWWRGRTVGKLATGLRVVTTDGAPIRLRHAVLRSMGGVADLLLPPGGITGLLFVWGTARNQRIGDLLAGTVVVRAGSVEDYTGAVWFPIPPGWETFAEQLDPTAMDDRLYTLVRSFLLRVHELGRAGRDAVAERLAETVAGRIGFELPPGTHHETFLVCAAARYQRRHRPPTGTPLPPPGPPRAAPGSWRAR